MLIPRRTPVLLTTTTSQRADVGNKAPIFGTTNNWRLIYSLPVGPFIKAGDIFDASFSLHVTNDAFRPDPNPVVWETRLELSDDESNDPTGSDVIERMRPHRIGDEAHHGLIVARNVWEVPTTHVGQRYLKLLAWFRHPDANGSQDMECPDNGFGIQLLWYRS